MAVFSGLYESHEQIYRAMRTVYYRRIGITIEIAIKVGIFFIISELIVALPAAGAKRCEYSPNGGVQWLILKP